ncbi:MAG: BACON domain-containing protein [Porphyromonas sp.]|nr:BACON domain-containing protein [Porphyromonas sp.]
MKHKIYIVLLLLASLVASCGRDTVLEPTTLTVSPSGLITLDSSEQTKTLVVSTNHGQWASVKNADWVSLSQEGNQLNIKLAANTSAESREADILIIAGEAREQLRITQLGLGVSISTNQESIDLNQWGAALTIDVESNSSDWVAETEEAWIHLQPMYAMSELRITVDETTEREDRVGKIYIKTRDGRGLHEVQVTQRGAMYYVLPSMEFLQSSEELRDFELARKSENSQIPDGRFNLYNWGYKTKSSAFPLITYLVYNNRYKTAKVYSAHGDFFRNRINLEGQRTFLLRHGFEQVNELEYYNAQTSVRAQIVLDGYVYYTYRPAQPALQATLTAFPYRYMRFSAGSNSLITGWETSHGGTLNAERSSINDPNEDRDILWYDVADAPLLASVYRVSRANAQRTITSVFLILRDSSQVYYEAGGALHLTNEFVAFMQREGFVSMGDIGPGYRFYHLGKMISVVVSMVRYEGIDEPKVEFQISSLEE